MLNEIMLSRAEGCLLGQLAGDSLGSLVEFLPANLIRNAFPFGPRDLADGGTWNTLAGQPTDDSEMALALARSLVQQGGYDIQHVAQSYVRWYRSEPFDIGNTTTQALRPAATAMDRGQSAAKAARYSANQNSQANGALMRISPLGIWVASHTKNNSETTQLARLDASLTHPNQVCGDANALFVVALSSAIRDGLSARDVHAATMEAARMPGIHPTVFQALKAAQDEPPEDYYNRMGWVLTAFQNAFWQLLHAPNLEEGVVSTVMAGGDTDTNAAIAGALLGAVYGREAVPSRWTSAILDCRPESNKPGVHQPRPVEYWPVDAVELAGFLLKG